MSKKSPKVTFIAAAVTYCDPFASVSDMSAAFNRIAAFGIIGSEACPLLAYTVTDKQIEKAQKSLDKHREEGGVDAEFDMSVFDKTWSSKIPSGFLPQVTEDVNQVCKTWVLIRSGNGGVINGWNFTLKVKGVQFSAEMALGAIIGHPDSKISFRDVLKAMK